jgi:sporulation protein YlmC with PRC-barrel domain
MQMATTDHTASLHTIGDDNLQTNNPAEDVRGRKVLDRAGEDIGHVDNLLVDDREHKVRFLCVAAGGFLGRQICERVAEADSEGDSAEAGDQTGEDC